jgi:hypothetical protein
MEQPEILLEDKRCEQLNSAGEKCGGFKISGSKFCHTHSSQEERAAAKVIVDQKLLIPGGSVPGWVNLKNSKGIDKAYRLIINAGAKGEMRQAAIGPLVYALKGYIEAIDKITLMERLEKLEQAQGLVWVDGKYERAGCGEGY